MTLQKRKNYYDSLLIYFKGKCGGYKLYALHRKVGQKINGETIWGYNLMPVPNQSHFGFATIDEIYQHAYKLFKGNKSLFDQWASELQKDGRPVNIGILRNALLYQWKVENG